MNISNTVDRGESLIRHSFSVEHVSGCVIVRGPIPIGAMATLLRELNAAAVVSTQLGKRFGATMVAGLAADLDRLAEMAPPMPLRPGAELLPADAIRWLQTGERGDSSEALFDATLDGHYAARIEGAAYTPRDVSDFVRCRLLVEQVASVAQNFSFVAQRGVYWRGWVAAWPQLCESLDAEVADFRSGSYAAPKTQALIDSLNGQSRDTARKIGRP
jgi:hypothetical protein